MGNLTGKELAAFAISKIGTPYVYGAKGRDGKFTENRLDVLSNAYPKYFTATYSNKAKKFIGQVCTDCSGLISWYTGYNKSSQMYHDSAKEIIKINKSDISKIPVGALVWRSGHIGVYIGDGFVVEARGINYGVVKTKLVSRDFTHILLMGDFLYEDVKNDSDEVKIPATAKVTFYPMYIGTSNSLVDALSDIGCKDTSFTYRKKIALANSVKNYTGSAEQNTALIHIIKNGRLIRP